MSDDLDEYGFEDEEVSRPRDSKIDDVKELLLANYFPSDGTEVYYGRQLEILLERHFFHWITKKGLNELVQERKIALAIEQAGYHKAHFYSPRRHRYPRRQIKEILDLIVEFSDPTFTRALGSHGELLADAGFAEIGFRIIKRNVKEVDDKHWIETNHDLDRLIMRDRVRYGVEIKNQLGYIDQTEFQTKLAMCQYFGVRPMFITRMMPKSYIYKVVQAGGFSMIIGEQCYPLMADKMAKRVRDRLQLPVVSKSKHADTVLSCFEKWHGKQIKKG